MNPRSERDYYELNCETIQTYLEQVKSILEGLSRAEISLKDNPATAKALELKILLIRLSILTLSALQTNISGLVPLTSEKGINSILTAVLIILIDAGIYCVYSMKKKRK